jgi:DNA repair protein RecO (recombination protein O)
LALEREPNPRLYRMLVGVLRTIAERRSPLVVPAFYWKLLAAEGLQPELHRCVRCGETEPDVTLVAFDLAEGGVLCRSCRSGTPISPAALGLLRDVLGGRLNEALCAPESPVTHEVGVLATRALEHHIERRLRTIAMFE